MKQNMAVRELRRLGPALRIMGVTGLYLFGSTARNESNETSDIDLMVDYSSKSRFSLITLSQVRRQVEAQLHVPVDVVTRDSLKASIRPDVERDAIRIF